MFVLLRKKNTFYLNLDWLHRKCLTSFETGRMCLLCKSSQMHNNNWIEDLKRCVFSRLFHFKQQKYVYWVYIQFYHIISIYLTALAPTKVFKDNVKKVK